MQSLTVAYRAFVMIGTLVVGALAYRAYGPQLEKLEPLVSRAQEIAVEAWWPDELATESEGDIDPLAAPEAFAASATPLTRAIVDSEVHPASTWPPSDAAPASPPQLVPASEGTTEVSEIVRALNELGVTEYSLNPWGDGGNYYRFRCSAPWGDGGRYARQFEAVASKPVDAARQVLQQIEQVQGVE